MRDAGHADRYTKLVVKYVDHHNPDLLLFDAAGEEMQRIDLTRLRTTHNIHKLLRMLGMRETCRDLNNACAEWAKSGQCSANPAYMKDSCRKACGLCAKDATEDDGPPCTNSAPERDCEYWSTMGECAHACRRAPTELRARAVGPTLARARLADSEPFPSCRALVQARRMRRS